MKTSWREELAWSAGFYDGEGNARLTHGVNDYGQMSINQVNVLPLKRFQAAVLGLGRINGPYKHGEWQDIYTWRVSSFQDVQAVAVMLWPFLEEVKKNQLKPVLENMHFSPPTWKSGESLEGITCKRGHPASVYRTKWGQCRACMTLSDRERRPLKGNKLKYPDI